jgi:HEAT repeat protein
MWMDEMTSKDPTRKELAMRAIMGFGPRKSQEAVPTLLKAMANPDKTDLSVRLSGVEALGTILSNAEKPETKQIAEAMKIFQTLCKDDQVIVKTRAVQAIAQLGGLASQTKKAKKEMDPEVLKHPDVLEEVIKAYPEASKVAADKETWEARQAGIRTYTLICMLKMRGKTKWTPNTATMAVYYARLNNDNSIAVKIATIQSLAQIPLEDAVMKQDRLNALDRIINNKSDELQVLLWAHLVRISVVQEVTKRDLVPLCDYLKSKDPTVRSQTAQAFGMLGEKAAKDEKGNVVEKGLAERSLIAAIKEEREHIAITKDKEKDTSLGVLAGLMTALLEVDPPAGVTHVGKLLDDPESVIRVQAALALGGKGPKAKAASAQLRFHCTDTELGVAASCMNALLRMDEDKNPSFIASLLTDKDAGIRIEAAKALNVHGEKAKGTARDLIAHFRDPDISVATACMSALVSVDPDGAAKELSKLLKDPDPARRIEASKALSLLGPKGIPAMPELIATLKDSDVNVVASAILALASVKAFDAIPDLDTLSKDRSQPRAIMQGAKDAIEIIRNLKKLDDLKKDKK